MRPWMCFDWDLGCGVEGRRGGWEVGQGELGGWPRVGRGRAGRGGSRRRELVHCSPLLALLRTFWEENVLLAY